MGMSRGEKRVTPLGVWGSSMWREDGFLDAQRSPRKKTLDEDMRVVGARQEDAMDRDRWRGIIQNRTPE